MKILTQWLRSYLPALPISDTQLAEDLTLRGIAVEGIFPLDPSGSVLDMDITTNRVDAMNHYGIAREAAAIYNLPLHPHALSAHEITVTTTPIKVEIASAAEPFCGRFTAQVIRNVTIGPSLDPIAEYFNVLGQKQISNAVDITNFVLLGIGHPTHAFDLDKVVGGITVRPAHPGEQIKLLDGTTRTLVQADLVIADDVKALSLAGIMGGFDSMITAETRNILVESAWFSPAGIRASSRRHLIHTDASHRFERGADFAAAPIANALVTQHILNICGGTPEGHLVDLIIPHHESITASRPAITLSVAEVQRHLGTTLAPEGVTSALIVQYLTALGCKLTAAEEETYSVTLPSWRLDLTRQIDLVEEIARVYGYNRFANTLPTPGVVQAHPTARAESAVRSRLLALGFSEAISSTFASPAENTLFAPQIPGIALENPLNEDLSLLRPSLLPGMVTMLSHNLNRDIHSARLFETGAIFTGTQAVVEESLSLSLGITANPTSTPLHSAQDAAFFELKGAIESLLSLFATPPPQFTLAAPSAAFETSRSAHVLLGESTIATFGQLSAAEAVRRKLRQPIYLAQLNLAELLKHPLKHVIARELSRFQAVERDFSFTFADSVQYQTLADALHALAIPEMQSFSPAEIFRDAKKNPGHYSLLLHTTFQSPHRTLREEDLTLWSAQIIAVLEQQGGTLRAK